MPKKTYFVYIVQCQDGTYYTGSTNDITARIQKHNAGLGAKYTRGRLPVKLKYSKKFSSKAKALSREWNIKKLARKQKKALIEGYL
ncbi:MAG: GIY-YIG nuclease family protein [Candidatus Omnitrophica bacterium]|nr:GIY-YIG nuclease family protein [Candidatus Omnitrophota bacterium]